MKTFFLILLTFKLSAQVPTWFDDKAKHFYVAAGSAYLVSEIVYQTTDLDGLAPLVGTGFALAITYGKELIYDGMMHRGTKSFADGVFGTGGAFTGGMVHRVRIDIHDRRQERELQHLEKSKRILD